MESNIMSRSSGGTNRVCFSCRLKYPGFVAYSEHENQTLSCSECGGILTEIPDSIRVPRRSDIKGWKSLQKDCDNNTFKRPIRKSHTLYVHGRLYPEQRNQMHRIERTTKAMRIKSDFESLIKGDFSKIAVELLENYANEASEHRDIDKDRDFYLKYKDRFDIFTLSKIRSTVSKYYYFNRERAKKRLTQLLN